MIGNIQTFFFTSAVSNSCATKPFTLPLSRLRNQQPGKIHDTEKARVYLTINGLKAI
jgi:hypothetical protein